MNIKDYIKESITTKQKILSDECILDNIQNIAHIITEGYSNGKKVITAGNGGSAGDAQHIVTELLSKFMINRKSLSALALTVDTSVLTAIGNDFGFENVFSRQIYANGNEGDIFIAISTSGNSPNIVNALIAAKEKKIITIGLTGENKSDSDKYCDYLIKVPSLLTPVIQESHIMIAHIICGIIEENIFKEHDICR